jgi:hypothetical protein
MVIDKEYMRRLHSCYRYSREKFTAELEQILYDRLGTESEPDGYSEQDLHEQSRKIIMQYQSPEGRLRLLYGLDKIENNIAYLQNKFAYLERKIAYQLQDGTHPAQEFYPDIIYEDGPEVWL